jgi:hypothetical protein
MTKTHARQDKSSIHFAGAVALATALAAAPVEGAPITADFSGTASIGSGAFERSVTFTDFVEPAAVDFQADLDPPFRLRRFYSVESRALDRGDGTLEFGQVVDGQGTHRVDVSSNVTTTLGNTTADPLFGVLRYTILPGAVSLSDYLGENSGTAAGSGDALMSMRIGVDGVDVVLGAAQLDVTPGASAATTSVDGAAALLAGGTVTNDPTSPGTESEGAGTARFSWDLTTGAIDLGLIAPGETVTVDFLLRTAISGSTDCTSTQCFVTSASIFDPPGFGSIRTYSLTLEEDPFARTVTPGDFPDIYSAFDTPTGTVVVPPSGPGYFDVPAPAPLALLMAALGLFGWRIRSSPASPCTALAHVRPGTGAGRMAVLLRRARP